MSYYWKLLYRIGDEYRELMIPPEPVNGNGLTPIDVVNQRWENGLPIKTSSGTIPANQIKGFEQTERPYSNIPLLEAGARAFGEPIETDMGDQNFIKTDGSIGTVHYKGIAAKWVKQITTTDKWERYYSHFDSYHKLAEESGMVTMAFKKATHDIDTMLTPECNQKEVDMLTKSR